MSPMKDRVTCELNGSIIQITGPEDANYRRLLGAVGQTYPTVKIPESSQHRIEPSLRPTSIFKKQDSSPGLMNALTLPEHYKSLNALISSHITKVLSILWSFFAMVLEMVRLLPPTSPDLADLESLPESSIRAMAWDRYKERVAVALKDNSVHIYDVSCKMWLSTHLRHHAVTDVTCLAFAPNAGMTIAIGCHAGICLWTLTGLSTSGVSTTDGAKTSSSSTSTATTMGTKLASNVEFLKFPGHTDVTCISWSPNGKFFASTATSEIGAVVWDSYCRRGTPLSLLSAPCHLAKWSPSGRFLFVAPQSKCCFWIFETCSFAYQVWEGLATPCQSATWCDKDILLFTLHNTSSLYSVQVALQSVNAPRSIYSSKISSSVPSPASTIPSMSPTQSGVNTPLMAPNATTVTSTNMGGIRGNSSAAGGMGMGMGGSQNVNAYSPSVFMSQVESVALDIVALLREEGVQNGDDDVVLMRVDASETGQVSPTPSRSPRMHPERDVSESDVMGRDVCIHHIEVDPLNERLALVLKGSKPMCDRVVVLSLQLRPTLTLSKIGTIAGPAEGSKALVAFRPRMSHQSSTRGALLACAWNSGAMTFCPMAFVPTHASYTGF